MMARLALARSVTRICWPYGPCTYSSFCAGAADAAAERAVAAHAGAALDHLALGDAAAHAADVADVGGGEAVVLDDARRVLALLEQNVDVAADELRDRLALVGEQREVVVLVVAKVERERLGRGRPAAQVRERELALDGARLALHDEHGVARDAEALHERLLLARARACRPRTT
jgi:hypothetical protein